MPISFEKQKAQTQQTRTGICAYMQGLRRKRHGGPPAIKMRFIKDLIEICALRRRGRHTCILRVLVFYSGKIIFFSFPPSSFLPSLCAFIPFDLWDYMLNKNWYRSSVPQFFSLAVSSLNIRSVFSGAEACTCSPCMGFPVLEKFAPLLVTQKSSNWDKSRILSFFIFMVSFILLFCCCLFLVLFCFLFLFFTLQKSTNCFVYCFVYKCMIFFIIIFILNSFCGGSQILYEDIFMAR